MTLDNLKLPPMSGMEIKPGVVLLDEPTPVVGTNKLRALANVCGCLCVVELAITFKEETNDQQTSATPGGDPQGAGG